MATFYSHKLLLCMGILCVLAAAPTALAADDTENKDEASCAAGEESDAEGECCIPNLMVEEDGEDKCKKVPSDMAVSVSVTLISSFVFLISLQFFMNHPDTDMQENSYNVISSTVSIFSAVLLFQSIDGLIENLIIEPYEDILPEHCLALLVDGIHMILWYALTQLVIAKVSGALLPRETREHLLYDWDSPEPGKTGIVTTAKVEKGDCQIPVSDSSGLSAGLLVKIQDESRTIISVAPGIITTRAPVRSDYNAGATVTAQIEIFVAIKCTCWGMVLAHLTGFASINFWTTIQQMEPFNQSPLLALVPLPMSIIGQLILQRITDKYRESHSHDGKKDWFVDKWDETCEEAENDIMGLALSVIIVNVCRFSLNGFYGHKCLPNAEQKEEGESCEFERPLSQVLWLLGVGLMFAAVLFMTKLIVDKFCPEEEEEEEGEEEEAKEKKEGEGEGEKEEEEKSLKERIQEQTIEVLIVTLSMCFSWCIFHGSHQLLPMLNPSFLGNEENAGTLAVALALIVTYVAFIFIRLLDMLADLPDEYTPPAVDDAIRQVISAMSIFIGFAWEQTFDQSVDDLAERMRVYGGPHAPALAKVLIGGGCVGIVFIAWKNYILPFVVKKGWNFTYVYSKHDLIVASRALAQHDKEHKQEDHDAIEKQLIGSKKDEGYENLAGNEKEELMILRKRVADLQKKLEGEDSLRKKVSDLQEKLAT